MITSCGKFVPMQSMKTYGEMEVQLHEVLASTIRKINSSQPIRFTPGEYLQVSVLTLILLMWRI